MGRRPLATTKDLAEFLGVPEATLKQWRYLKTGPNYCKLNQHVRYDWTEVEAWLDAQSAKSA